MMISGKVEVFLVLRYVVGWCGSKVFFGETECEKSVDAAIGNASHWYLFKSIF